jgi:hypothetical protein
MAIEMKTPGLQSVALRVTDLERAKGSYVQTPGFPVLLETEEGCLSADGRRN